MGKYEAWYGLRAKSIAADGDGGGAGILGSVRWVIAYQVSVCGDYFVTLLFGMPRHCVS